MTKIRVNPILTEQVRVQKSSNSSILSSNVSSSRGARPNTVSSTLSNPEGLSALAARAKSFVYAGQGVVYLVKMQHSAWIHMAFSLCVIVLGVMAELSIYDWRWIMVCLAMVWTAEGFNTAIEAVCDVACPEFHPLIKIAKDVGAGAVLISSVFAALIGLSIFSPFIKQWIQLTF